MAIAALESLAVEDETIMKEIGEKVIETHVLQNVFPSLSPKQSTQVAMINTQEIFFKAANIECDDNGVDKHSRDL